VQKKSAGLLAFRESEGVLEVLLAHPGGPFWAHKDVGAWSIPKGEFLDPETPLDAAKREFQEECGLAPVGEFLPLGAIRQNGGKIVHAWAIRLAFDPAALCSNTFSIEWPPRSGKQCEFPEVDRAAWFTIPAARAKMLESQQPFLDRLAEQLAAPPAP
jgi:predicted NUDIX family NTP pyrophosphohydrolase